MTRLSELNLRVASMSPSTSALLASKLDCPDWTLVADEADYDSC